MEPMSIPQHFSKSRFQRTFDADEIITNSRELKIFLLGLRVGQRTPTTNLAPIASYCLQWLANPHASIEKKFLWVQYVDQEDSEVITVNLCWAKARSLDDFDNRSRGYEIGTVSCFEYF